MHGQYGTQPLQVARFAVDEFNKIREYDQVFVVFDRDDHTTYHDALNYIDSQKGKLKNTDKKTVKITAIPSNACFELWLLLHFEDIQQWIHRDEIFERLEAHLTGYAKGQGGHYKGTRKNIADAIVRARRLCERYNPHEERFPYTNVYELVELLYSFATKT
jgi:hypothetical protein